MADPDPQLLAEFDEVLAAYQELGQRLAGLAERMA